MDNTQIDAVFRSIDRPIWVITSYGKDSANGRRRGGGLVATWVNQASIDYHHPTVTIGVATNHFTTELIDESSYFGLHLLLPNQTDIALNFALGSGRQREKLSGVALRQGDNNSPILADCFAWLDCQVFFRIHGGDRVYYYADVTDGCLSDPDSAESPLVESQLMQAATKEQCEALKSGLESDIRAQRPLYREWREQLSNHPHPEFGRSK